MKRKAIQEVSDLEVYCRSYSLAIEVFELSKKFPKEELYSLTNQLRRSSRSVPANISEGSAKRFYWNIFRQHLNTAIGSAEETKTWLDFAKDSQYISPDDHEKLKKNYVQVGAMLYRLIQNWH